MISGKDEVARRSLTSPGGRSIIVAVTVCPGERISRGIGGLDREGVGPVLPRGR